MPIPGTPQHTQPGGTAPPNPTFNPAAHGASVKLLHDPANTGSQFWTAADKLADNVAQANGSTGKGSAAGGATGAVAGNPGTFTPASSTPPANYNEMTQLTATPQTAWTTGQHVVAENGDAGHWSGTAWATGNAP